MYCTVPDSILEKIADSDIPDYEKALLAKVLEKHNYVDFKILYVLHEKITSTSEKPKVTNNLSIRDMPGFQKMQSYNNELDKNLN